MTHHDVQIEERAQKDAQRRARAHTRCRESARRLMPATAGIVVAVNRTHIVSGWFCRAAVAWRPLRMTPYDGPLIVFCSASSSAATASSSSSSRDAGAAAAFGLGMCCFLLFATRRRRFIAVVQCLTEAARPVADEHFVCNGSSNKWWSDDRCSRIQYVDHSREMPLFSRGASSSSSGLRANCMSRHQHRPYDGFYRNGDSPNAVRVMQFPHEFQVSVNNYYRC